MIEVRLDFSYCNNIPVLLRVSSPGNLSLIPLDMVAFIWVQDSDKLTISMMNGDQCIVEINHNTSKVFFLNGVEVEFLTLCKEVLQKVEAFKAFQLVPPRYHR